MDFLDAISELFDHLDGTWWGIDGLKLDPDLTGYQKQKTGRLLFPVEYIYQGGRDDGFSGTIFFPITGEAELFLKVNFCG